MTLDAEGYPDAPSRYPEETATGALYVKDDEALRLAEELATRRGITKTAAVRLALSNELAREPLRMSVMEIAAERRRTSKLTYDPDVVIDKAFYDSLYEDHED